MNHTLPFLFAKIFVRDHLQILVDALSQYRISYFAGKIQRRSTQTTETIQG